MRVALLAASLISISCQTVPGPVAVEPDATYSHVATGLAFPPSLAGFERTHVTRYDPDQFNVSGHYELHRPIRLVATVYHYPATRDGRKPSEPEFDQHFRQARAEMLAQNPSASVKSEGVRQFRINGFTLPGSFAIYYMDDFRGTGMLLDSSLYLLALDGWYLKFRFSTQGSIDEIEPEIDDFISSFTWQVRDAPRQEPGSQIPDAWPGQDY